MAGHSRPKDGVATLAYVPATHALLWCQGVDARDKRGHDAERTNANKKRLGFVSPKRSVRFRVSRTNIRFTFQTAGEKLRSTNAKAPPPLFSQGAESAGISIPSLTRGMLPHKM